MKKVNQTEEVPPAEVVFDAKVLERARDYFAFPVDKAAWKIRDQLQRHEDAIQHLENAIEDYEVAIEQNREAIAAHEVDIEELKPQLEGLRTVTTEEAKAELEKLAKLPWIEKVELNRNGGLVQVTTRPGMLKTRLDTRVVDLGEGRWRTEYVAEPVTVPLPQYQISVGITRLGEKGIWANNAGALGIRLVNVNDVNTFIGGKVMAHATAPHWATPLADLNDWTGLCLGEYHEGISEASKKGLIDFLLEVAAYLQTCGDGHAYRRKEVWALTLGKPEYNEHVYRLAEKSETAEIIEERYKRDYRTVNAVQTDGLQVNPGTTTMGTTTMDIRTFAFTAWTNPLPTWLEDPVTAQEDEDCGCDNSPEEYEFCDCGGHCGCHEEYR